MSRPEQYDEDYFLRGKASGKSLYEDYRWLPELTLPMVRSMIVHLGIRATETVLDFGCARGYIVRAFVEQGIEAFGVDASKWAIENADEAVRARVFHATQPWGAYNWIIAKDVLEHVPVDELEPLVQAILDRATKGVFVVVPLSPAIGEPYICPDYEKDVTHVVRWDLFTWMELFRRHMGKRFFIEATYRVPGVKDNWSEWPEGNGFLTLHRK